jgi:hypothetical protein
MADDRRLARPVFGSRTAYGDGGDVLELGARTSYGRGVRRSRRARHADDGVDRVAARPGAGRRPGERRAGPAAAPWTRTSGGAWSRRATPISVPSAEDTTPCRRARSTSATRGRRTTTALVGQSPASPSIEHVRAGAPCFPEPSPNAPRARARLPLVEAAGRRSLAPRSLVQVPGPTRSLRRLGELQELGSADLHAPIQSGRTT